jgi:peptidoglycan/LPS O-acetylase OafA/YrhL
MSFKYRPDVDGLRALAVSLVVLFHAFPGFLPGGFIGVDVFFVISGFLISSIIFQGLEVGTFTLRDFYARRIRRIFPALIVVLVTNLCAGWFVLFSDEFRDLGRDVFGAMAFISNFILWQTSGYFDTAAETKPLLHLWSLAIEEQFYLVYPLCVWLVFARRGQLVWMLGAAAVLSFATNVALLSRNHHEAAFYLPMGRLWELLLGAVLALVSRRQGEKSSSINTIYSTIGFALILVPAVLLNSASTFPGWNALAPTVGACLLLYSLPRALFINRIFTHAAIVKLGLVSYPLYLWHWSLLSFARIMGYTSVEVRTALVALSLLLATLTYWYVERPLRRSSSPRTALVLVSILISVGCIGLLVERSSGFPAREANHLVAHNIEQLKTQVLPPNLAQCPADFKPQFALTYCAVSRQAVPSIVLLGDSHAQDKFSGLVRVDTANTWLMLGHNSCPPVLGITVKGDHEYCEERFRDAIEYVNRSKDIKTVVLSFFGAYMLHEPFAADHKNSNKGPQGFAITSSEWPNSSKEELFERGLERAIDLLEGAGKRVILVIDVPELPFFPRDCVRLGWDNSACKVTRQDTLTRQGTLRRIVASILAKHPRLRVFDSVDLFCSEEVCATMIAEKLLYSDSHHLSEFGSNYFADAFSRWLERR